MRPIDGERSLQSVSHEGGGIAAGETTRWTQRAFRSLFKVQGLPDIIRVDNGAPFASMGPGGLSKLSRGRRGQPFIVDMRLRRMAKPKREVESRESSADGEAISVDFFEVRGRL